jgi:20S proteasome alpha/beta subunit
MLYFLAIGDWSSFVFAMSIGARSQSAKTYLESKYTEFQDGKING